MKLLPLPAHERLVELLSYSPDTGVFSWKQDRRGIIRKGDAAGHFHSRGYVSICVDGTSYKAHRLAWLYVHGKPPADQIDHINGVRDDNRIANLREATSAENHQNQGLHPTNSSGYHGVTWVPQRKRWKAQIKVLGKNKHLGMYREPEAAAEAYKAAKARVHWFQPGPREDAA